MASTRDSAWVVWGRRALTITSIWLALASMLALAPVWIPVALVYDLAKRGRRSGLGGCLFMTWYLLCELGGVFACALIWLRHGRDPERFLEANYMAQRRWVVALFMGAERCMGVRLEASGDECLSPGPLLVMLRHATVVDTLIPNLIGGVRYDLRLRFVLKRELLWDPCLDVVGHRLPNYFARRGTGAAEREIAGVCALAEDLGPKDGVLIYPEGTRFTARKRARIIDKARRAGDPERAAYAESLVHVLPPRLGGALGLLEASDADVVFCAHTGLEHLTSLWDLWRGTMRGRVLRVHFWRVPRVEVPSAQDERAAWLLDQWRRVDEWVAAASAPIDVGPAAAASSSRGVAIQ